MSATARTESSLDLSIVIPLHDEEDNIGPICTELRGVCDSLPETSEVLLIDDGSQDETFSRARAVSEQDPRFRVVRLTRNFGQTAAMQAGFDIARGEVIVTLDGDLQNDPKDIPRLLEGIESGFDIVAGWRRGRKDKLFSRRFPSWLANRLVRAFTGVTVRDNGCTLKAFRRSVMERTRIYSDLHRFLVVVMAMTGCRYTELPINHRARVAGRSKYGLSRTWKVVLDLLVLILITRFTMRPARWFGGLSVPFLFLAALSTVAAFLTLDSANYLVFPTAALLFTFAAAHLLLMAVVGELVVHYGDYRDARVVLARPFFEESAP